MGPAASGSATGIGAGRRGQKRDNDVTPPPGTRELCVDSEVGKERAWGLAREPPVHRGKLAGRPRSCRKRLELPSSPPGERGLDVALAELSPRHPAAQKAARTPRGRGTPGSPEVGGEKA